VLRSAFQCLHGAKHRRTTYKLMWAWCGFPKLVLLHPVGSVGHVVHSNASGPRNVMHYFSCLGAAGVVSINSSPGSGGHIVHSSASLV
jgi:hypothetical protein